MTDQSRDLKREILKRVDDLAATDRTKTAIAMVDAALAILAHQFPTALTTAERQMVQENYPDATDELVAARAMSEEGVITAAVLGTQMGLIAIDYSPLSHTPEVEQDLALSREGFGPLLQACESLFENAQQVGLSPFGMATLMMRTATEKAVEHGVHPMKLARPLFEFVQTVLEPHAPMTQTEHDEGAIRALRDRFGVSRETAKRMYEKVKRNH